VHGERSPEMGVVTHYHFHCHLAKFREFIYEQVKHGAVIG
jgi:hypothetical protein